MKQAQITVLAQHGRTLYACLCRVDLKSCYRLVYVVSLLDGVFHVEKSWRGLGQMVFKGLHRSGHSVAGPLYVAHVVCR